MNHVSLKPIAALLFAFTTATPALASDGCPRGFQYEKNNSVFSCLLKVSYSGTSQQELESARVAAMRKAERAYRTCAGPLQKPEYAGVVFSSRTNTEVSGGSATNSNSGPETLQLSGQVIFTCKL